MLHSTPAVTARHSAEITQTLDTLNRALAVPAQRPSTQPMVSTSGCTCCPKGGRR